VNYNDANTRLKTTYGKKLFCVSTALPGLENNLLENGIDFCPDGLYVEGEQVNLG